MGNENSGRHSKYDEIKTPKIAKELAMMGLTDSEISEKLGITQSTFYLWKQSYPVFSEALISGKESVDDRVENALLKRALGYTKKLNKEIALNGPAGMGATISNTVYEEHYPGEIGAITLWLKNRRPSKWREKTEQDVNLNVGVTIIDDVGN